MHATAMQTHRALAATFLVSLVVWLGISFANGGGEAWDAGAYWSIGLPAVYLAGAVAGLLTQVNVWKIVLSSGLGQLVGLILGASGWSLWPLGMILLAVLSLPVAAAATAARWVGRRLGRRLG